MPYMISITHRMPPWAQWILVDAGFEYDFHEDELTGFKNAVGKFVAALIQLQKKGKLTVKFVNEDEGPLLTFKAKDLFNELRR